MHANSREYIPAGLLIGVHSRVLAVPRRSGVEKWTPAIGTLFSKAGADLGEGLAEPVAPDK